MDVYMYVCIYVCRHLPWNSFHVHMYVRVFYMHMYVPVFVCVGVCTCVFVCVCVCVYKPVYKFTHKYTHMQCLLSIGKLLYAGGTCHSYARTRVQTFLCTSTHTNTRTCSICYRLASISTIARAHAQHAYTYAHTYTYKHTHAITRTCSIRYRLASFSMREARVIHTRVPHHCVYRNSDRLRGFCQLVWRMPFHTHFKGMYVYIHIYIYIYIYIYRCIM
jgi:hypothetical protein